MSRGHWTETNSSRALTESIWRHRNIYAYPINTIEKPKAVERILSWGKLNGIVGLGRWGTWEHLNSDQSVAEGISSAEKLLKSRWK